MTRSLLHLLETAKILEQRQINLLPLRNRITARILYQNSGKTAAEVLESQVFFAYLAQKHD